MSYLKLLPVIALLLGCQVSVRASEQPTLLQNFDLEANADFDQLEQVDIGDFNKDGSHEARFTASGRKAVFRLKLKRSSALLKRIMSGEKSVFRFDVTQPDGFTPATPTKLQVVIQTNAVGAGESDIYGKVLMKAKMGQVDAGTHAVAANLSKAVLSSGESVGDLLAKYEAGEGTYFMVIVLQVPKDDEVGSVIYDNFVMAAAE